MVYGIPGGKTLNVIWDFLIISDFQDICCFSMRCLQEKTSANGKFTGTRGLYMIDDITKNIEQFFEKNNMKHLYIGLTGLFDGIYTTVKHSLL